MASTTVSDTARHASPETVKSEPGLFHRLRDWRERRSDARTAESEPAQTKVAPRVSAPHVDPPVPAAGVLTVDRVAFNLIADLAHGLKVKASPAEFKRLVGPHWSKFLELAKPEEEFHATVTRRADQGLRRAEQRGDALEVLGEAVDTKAVARAMVAQSLHTTNPAEATGLLPVIREDAPPPFAVETTHSEPGSVVLTVVGGVAAPSPLHSDDGTAPPVPTGADVQAVDPKLPQRRGRDAYGESSQVVEHVAALADGVEPGGQA